MESNSEDVSLSLAAGQRMTRPRPCSKSIAVTSKDRPELKYTRDESTKTNGEPEKGKNTSPPSKRAAEAPSRTTGSIIGRSPSSRCKAAVRRVSLEPLRSNGVFSDSRSDGREVR